ncbi:hypothetical protein SHKM778_51800 [Streptomyces sp. KM77-8]|uniref:Uncharacterized protein n=1 Tax=Streptomyces haneummycinicus TaxID=3074435 RepID=A0AAT9HN16_9ACTN
MQVQAEPGSGTRMRVVQGGGAEPAGVPEGEADALAAVRPRGWRPDHEVYWVLMAVAGQGDGESGAQQSVGGDSRQVPAQQVGRQVP